MLEDLNLPSLNSEEDDDISYYLDKTWVQCESAACLKWRLAPSRDGDGFDPDRPWRCHMNTDPFFSQCLVPQGVFPNTSELQERGMKVVYSQLPVGGLVMVKVGKWPWWPAVLSPDPVSLEYVKRDSDGDVVKYHVEFLGSPHSRLWTSAKSLHLYQTMAMEPNSLKASLRTSYKVALAEAALLQKVTCEERLEQCVFKPQECESELEESGGYERGNEHLFWSEAYE
ncbi:hypothetical protein AAFF_G00009110 [Aldrovandia affinis]|uniref:Zinc finger CW-type PWWP domain protein 2 n=1 Tax=Aldrovandia affinis TaxID=143900 RepID=A0AAD7X016_9TELE|nr:hypothetical protein AAFF_G00009110 [Aldrovandia affinis]